MSGLISIENEFSSFMIKDICDLKSINSLSGTQLKAFCTALFSSIHCIQCPPGTGKVN
jgi:hypothetical protein